MNKNELIEQIAVSADITKAKAGLALEAFIEAVTTSLQKGKTCRWLASAPSRFPNALNARVATRRPAKPSRSPLASSRSSALAKSLRMLYNNRLV